MTTAQRGHVNTILRQVEAELFVKYERGTTEHGGNVWDHGKVALVNNAIEEALDLLVYLMTLREKLGRTTAPIVDPVNVDPASLPSTVVG